MNYVKITKHDIANGEGIRVVLWVNGCSLHCKGCHNPETWDFNSGKPFDEQAKQELFDALSNTYIDGITFSGGHPLEKENYETILQLTKEIKSKIPDKTIWLYTGYQWEDISKMEIIPYLDVVVDGKFIEEQKNISLVFKGSDNQRIIDVKKTLANNKISLWKGV